MSILKHFVCYRMSSETAEGIFLKPAGVVSLTVLVCQNEIFPLPLPVCPVVAVFCYFHYQISHQISLAKGY